VQKGRKEGNLETMANICLDVLGFLTEIFLPVSRNVMMQSSRDISTGVLFFDRKIG